MLFKGQCMMYIDLGAGFLENVYFYNPSGVDIKRIVR